MKSLHQQLLSRDRDTYEKLRRRFLKNLSSGNISNKTSREKHRAVAKLQHIETRLGISSTAKLKHWALALALGIVTLTAKAQTVPFRPEKLATEAPIGGNLIAADFDSDGDIDIVDLTYFGYHSILFGDGAGGFSDRKNIGLQSYKLEGFIHGDVDNDGDVDIVILEEYTAGIRVMLWSNDGSGTFESSKAFYEGTEISGNSLQIGDLDGDGDLDLLVQISSSQQAYKSITPGSGKWSVLVNDGGQFSYFPLQSYFSDYKSIVVVGDFDNDGDADILAASYYYEGGLNLYVNNGDLTSMSVISSVGGAYYTYSPQAVVEDMDQDGDLDVVLAYQGEVRYIKVFSGDGTGYFSQTFSASPYYLGEVFPIDADADADLELLMYYDYAEGPPAWNVLDLDVANGSLVEVSSSQFKGKFGSLKNLLPGDFDNDGDDEILGASYYELDLFENDGTGKFAVKTDALIDPVFAKHMVVADINGDGALDVVGNVFGNVFVNDGSGNFSVTQSLANETGYISEYLGIGDLDGDGDIDLVMAGGGLNYQYYDHNFLSVQVALNDGAGNFTPQEPVNLPSGTDMYAITVTNLDADADLEVAAVTNSNGPVTLTVLDNDGNGNLTFSSGASIYTYDPIGLFPYGDMDGDGDNDLVVITESRVTTLFQDAGSWTYYTGPFLSEGGVVSSYYFEDLDNDGDLDVILSNDYSYEGGSYFGKNFILPNDSTTESYFSNSNDFIVDRTVISNDVRAADFDNDGDADVFLTSYTGGNALFLNDGSSGFSFKEDTGGDLIKSYSASIGDFDGDGDVDLFSVAGNRNMFVIFNDLLAVPVFNDTTFTIEENPLDGAIVGTFGAVDANEDALTYSILSGNDNGAFAISGNDLIVSNSSLFDFETSETFTLEVEASDGSLTDQAIVMISVTDVDEAPEMESQVFEIAENQPVGTIVGTVSAPDPEGLEVTFALVSGNEDSVVAFDTTTGQITIADSSYFDFESVTQLLLEIAATDGTLDSINIVSINLINVNERPVATDTLFRIDESLANGTVIGRAVAEDPDGDVLAYTITGGNTDNGFAIDAATGEISINNTSSIDYDITPDYFLTITASDGTLETATEVPVLVTALERDKSALLDLFDATDGSGWAASTNWSEGNDLTEDWVGVTISDGRVRGLDLQDNNLVGEVLDTFQDLTGLQSLDLSGNLISAIPKFNFLSQLDTLDVSENKLSITELLHNVDVSNYTYAPQKEYGAIQTDTIHAGTDFTLTFGLANNAGDSYQWFRDDASVSGGDHIDLELVNLDFDQMGTYHLEIENTQLPDLTLNTAFYTIWAATDVSGSVSTTAGVAVEGQVDIYRIFDGPFELTDSATIAADGSYLIEDVVLGDFILLVKNDLEAFPEVIQTYYISTGDWQEADTLYLREAIEAIDITMLPKPVYTPVAGGTDFEGTLESDLPEEESENGRVLARRTVKRAGCSMRRFVSKGRDEQDGEYVDYAYVESDDEGRFNFDDIEPGKYLLNIQYPGVPMDPNSEIEFEVSENDKDVKYQIEAVVTEDGIVVNSKRILSAGKEFVRALTVFPNPTDGLLRVDFLVYRKLEGLRVDVFDLQGRKVHQQEVNASTELQTVIIDLESRESGIYLLVFTDKGETFSYVVKVSKK